MDVRTLAALEFDTLLSALEGYAESEPAKASLRSLRPFRRASEARTELERIEEIRDLIGCGSSYPGGGVADVRLFLKRAAVAGSSLEAEELLALLQNLRTHSTTRKLLDREKSRLLRVYDLTRLLEPLPDIESAVERAISSEGAVRDSASPELARLRRELHVQMETLRSRLTALVARLSRQGILREEGFSIREGRYVLPVRSDAMGKIKGIVHDRSATGGTLFVEPSSLIESGNNLRELELAERDEVRRILKELTALVRKSADQIEINLQAMTALDILWAKARLAGRLEATPPEIADAGPLRIVGARHPLLTLQGREVVSLSLDLGEDYSTLVISGPNSGGKSVALKCTGLIALMAGSGLPVPALPGTRVPLYRDVIADIGDQQSLKDDLSTFTAHTARLKEILDRADDRTLVLIDEMGAGTDPQEGASLSIAALETLTGRMVPVVVTTHHGALKAFAHTTPGCANGSMEFDRTSLRPTYRFLPQLPGSSYALDIALRAGLPEDIIGRARQLLGTERSELEDLIAALGEKIRRYDSLTVDETRRREELSSRESAVREREEQLRRQARDAKVKAAEELEELLKEARRTVEATVRELREKNADRTTIKSAQETLQRLRTEAKFNLGLPVIDIPQPPSRAPDQATLPAARPIAVDDWVKVDGSITGQITAISAHGERLCVAAGSVQLWVTRARVEPVEPPETTARVSRLTALPEVPFELDVRGLDAAEALDRVDRYIYDGYMNGRGRLGIVHGKGLGILSQHIRKHLKSHTLVKSFRFGEYGEGDYGVTIVELKE